MSFRHRTIPVTPFQQNCSLVWDDETMQAAVIDPGGDIPLLLAAVKELGLTLEQIWLTHAHIDHAGATGTLARTLGLPIEGPHEADQFWIDALPQQSRMFGFPDAEPFTPTRWLHDGDTVKVDRQTEAGYDEVVSPLPAVVSVTAGVVEPRYPSFKGIMAAKSKPVDQLTLADIGIEASNAGWAGAGQEIIEVATAAQREAGEIIEDDGEAFTKVVDFLSNLKVI